MKKPQFAIGYKFINKRTKEEEEVVDIYTTTNSKNQIISIRYVCSHKFMGQDVINSDVCESTIALSKTNN